MKATKTKKKKSNLASRVIVSIIAMPLIVALCWFGSYFFLGFVLLIGLGAFFEFRNMTSTKAVLPGMLLVPAAIIALQTNAFFLYTDYGSLILICSLLIFILELFRNKESALANIGSALFALLYFGLFPAALILIREAFPGNDQYGAYLILTLISAIWVCDTSAYFAGKSFGKHKLFERVSPKKTWEGAAAGFIGSILWFAAAKIIVLDFFGWSDVIIMGVITGSIGQIGDLIESLIKRDLEIKDSSSLIPGHGGIFDRFDSLLATAPVIYLYLRYFVIG